MYASRRACVRVQFRSVVEENCTILPLSLLSLALVVTVSRQSVGEIGVGVCRAKPQQSSLMPPFHLSDCD